MKLNELISDFIIATSNEEKKMLESITGLTPIDSFDERERFIIENLIRKSLVSKVRHDNVIMVLVNETFQ